MRRVSPRAVLFTAAVLVAGQVAHGQGPVADAPIDVGVIRADGVLLPVASMRNHTWIPLSITKPGFDGPRMSASARALPRAGWELRPIGGNNRALRLTKATSVSFECSAGDVFDTNLTTARRLEGKETARHLTLAVRGTMPTYKPAELSASPEESRGVRAFLTGIFGQLENTRFDALPKYALELRSFSAADRAQQPIRFTRLFRHEHSFNGNVLEKWHYVEVERGYAESRLVFSMGGWLHEDFGSMSLIDVSSGLGTAAEEGQPETQVLGIVHYKDRRQRAQETWVMASHSNLDFQLSLVDIDAQTHQARPVVEVFVSHCTP